MWQGLPHCCWSAKKVTSTKPIRTRANTISPAPKGTPYFEASRRTYVGIVNEKSKMLWKVEMKVTLRRKNRAGDVLALTISL